VDDGVDAGHGLRDQVDVTGTAGEERVNGTRIGTVETDDGSAVCREFA
jgi:hypothetical protein